MRIEIERTDANPFIPDPGMVHWACSLEGGSRPVRFVISLDGASFGNGTPDDEAVVGLLGADMETVLAYPDADDWLHEYALEGDDPADRLRARGEIARVRAEIEASFGPEAVEALVAGSLPPPVAPAW